MRFCPDRPFFLAPMFVVSSWFLSPGIYAQSSSYDTAKRLIERMDRNQDGDISPDEIPAASKAAIDKLANEARLDSSRDMSVRRLLRQLERNERNEQGDSGRSDDRRRFGRNDNSRDSGNRDRSDRSTGDRNSNRSSEANDSSDSSDSPSSGFGTSTNAAPRATSSGFGTTFIRKPPALRSRQGRKQIQHHHCPFCGTSDFARRQEQKRLLG
ncbi:MAG: hypothetical protein R3C28_20685 [Pirellulaceae bacterium]